MSHFELTLKGFDGGTDDSDSLIIWISAPVTTVAEVKAQLEELGVMQHIQQVCEICAANRAILTSDDIDYYLPAQKIGLMHRINALCAEQADKKWGKYYNIVKTGGATIQKPDEARATLMLREGYNPDRPEDVLSYLDSVGTIDFQVSIKQADE